MAKIPLHTPEQLRQFLRYEPETGMLFWLERQPSMFRASPNKSAEAVCLTWNKRFAGKVAFNSPNGTGYKAGRIADFGYLSHRVIWAMTTGRWPAHEIDHINRDRSDNRIANLREADRAANGMNRSISATNSSGANGVTWAPKPRKWHARIQIRGKRVSLGYFTEFTDAVSAREKADAEYRARANMR